MTSIKFIYQKLSFKACRHSCNPNFDENIDGQREDCSQTSNALLIHKNTYSTSNYQLQMVGIDVESLNKLK